MWGCKSAFSYSKTSTMIGAKSTTKRIDFVFLLIAYECFVHDTYGTKTVKTYQFLEVLTPYRKNYLFLLALSI